MTARKLIASGLLLLTSVGCSGCQRPTEVHWVSSAEVEALPAKVQTLVHEQLTKACGTPTQPKMLGAADDKVEPNLLRGAAVYQARCAACHGSTGDGNGPAAAFMYPRPRDYRRGVFKFASTPYGAKPLRDDIVRTVRQGARGTSMPAFNLLPPDDLQAVVDYVLVLTHRGELETLLALEADSDDTIDPANVDGYVTEILGQWNKARSQLVHPLTVEPPLTPESIEIGKRAFLSETAGCFKCHGNDGRGQPANSKDEFKDMWGHQTRAADLTAGMFHGGGSSEVLYRRIYAGINGTPMPAFAAKLADQPDTFWHLVHYVQYFSGARRRELLADQAEYHKRAQAAADKGGE
jgi:mono/diheme cytochrome c family protein